MAPSRNERAKPSAQPGYISHASHHQYASKVQKKPSKKQRQATKALQMTMDHLHAPHAGQHYRKAARRWVRAQLEAKAIHGRIAQQLFLFIKEREIGRGKKGGIEREDLAEEAEATWVRYLGELAEDAGDEHAVARNQAAVRALKAAKEGLGEDNGASGAVDDEEEDDNRIMLSPEPQGSEEEVGVLGAMEVGNHITLCHRPREMAKEEL